MPLAWVEHEGQRYSLEDVLENGALAHRFPLTYLQLVCDDRKWKGRPSVTQCIGGTRQAYLKITVDYGVNPDKAAFQVLGTKVHRNLDTQEWEITEFDVGIDDMEGTLDLLEPAPGGGYILTDHKTVGSYRIVKALGIEKIDVPVHDENGAAKFYQSGKKKGQMVTRKEHRRNEEKVDIHDWALQLNKYRLMAREALDAKGDKTKVVAMRIFAIVRDGGLWISESRGIEDSTFSVPVPEYPDAKVEAFFEAKATALLGAVLDGRVPAMCSEDENWGGTKCRDWCEVSEACKALGDNPHLGGMVDAPGSIAAK